MMKTTEQPKRAIWPEQTPEDASYRFRFMRRSSFFIVPVGLSYALLYLLFGFSLAAASQTAIILSIVPFLVYFDRMKVSLEAYGHTMTLATLLSVINSAWFFGGSSTPGLVWFAVALIPSMLFLKRSTTIFWMLISALSIVGFVIAEQRFQVVFPFPPDFLVTFKLFTIAGACAYIFVFLYASRKTSEQAIEDAQANEQAAQEASAAKSLFLTKMSHELRTPLNAIMGYAELIQEELDEEQVAIEQMKNDVNAIQRSSQVLKLHLSNILDLSKIERGQYSLRVGRVQLKTLLRMVIQQAQAFEVRGGVTLVLESQLPDDFVFESDEPSIVCVLSNLLDNAFKFTQQGQIQLSVDLSESREWLLFQVKDEGIGICSTQLQRIFDSFVQVEEGFTRSYDGIGIGLTLSQQMALQLGGTLTVSSQEKKGATFTLSIPYVPSTKPTIV